VTAYATRGDVFKYGAPRGSLVSEGREVASSLASSNVLTLEGHGFETDDAVLVRAAEGGTLSAPLSAGTTYYVIRLTDSTFKLAATAGGSEINLSSDGVSMIVSIALPFDEILEFYSRWVDDLLPAHAVPLDSPYPVTVVATVAELAGKRLQQIAGVSSVAMTEIETGAKARLERWSKGIPLRDAAATAATNKAVTASLVGISDTRGWGSETLP